MAALTVVSGKVLGAPNYKETNNALIASFKIKSRRYDFERKKNVEDPYTVFAYGKTAQYLRDNSVGEGSFIAAFCENRVDENGVVVFEARRLSLFPEDGFELHIAAGAVEKGRHSTFAKKDGGEGEVVSASMRLPGHTADGAEYNRTVRISAWDGRARGLSKACVLDEDDDSDRTWIIVWGTPKTEKYETNDGETRTITKTTVEGMEITPEKSLKHVYASAAEVGHEAAAPTLDAVGFHGGEDEDVPF